MIFSHEKILEIHSEAIDAGLHSKRNAMLMGVNGDYVAGLDVVGNPSDQLMSDLGAMNNIGGEVCGVPVERWLRNAAYAVKTQPDKQKFFSELADEAVRAVLPPSLAGIYPPICAVFKVSDLRAILIHDLKRGSADFSLLRATGDQSVLCLLQETQKHALTRELLEALRSAQPENKVFAVEIRKALEAFEGELADRPGHPAILPPEPMLRPVETTDDLRTILRKALRRAGCDLRPVTVTTRNQEKFVGALMADKSDGGIALLGWFQLSPPQDEALRDDLEQLINRNQLWEALELASQHHIEPEMRNPIKTLSSSGVLNFTPDTVRLFLATDILQNSKESITGLEDERPLMWATP